MTAPKHLREAASTPRYRRGVSTVNRQQELGRSTLVTLPVQVGSVGYDDAVFRDWHRKLGLRFERSGSDPIIATTRKPGRTREPRLPMKEGTTTQVDCERAPLRVTAPTHVDGDVSSAKKQCGPIASFATTASRPRTTGSWHSAASMIGRPKPSSELVTKSAACER